MYEAVWLHQHRVLLGGKERRLSLWKGSVDKGLPVFQEAGVLRSQDR